MLGTLLTALMCVGAPPEAEASYAPIVGLSFGEMRLEVPLSVASRFEKVGGFDLDRYGTRLETETISSQIRIGVRFDSKLDLKPILLFAEYEQDLLTGTHVGRNELEGIGLPASDEVSHPLRKAWGRVSLGWFVHLAGGVTTSHWGLGLLANDGTHGWTPESASFVDPRGGDRVLRAALATGPHSDEKIFASVAVDSVVDDDVLLEGDSAYQLIGAAIVGRGLPSSVGLYVVGRSQEAASGAETNVTVLDLYGKTEIEFKSGKLALSGEIAYISGDTGLAGTPDFPIHTVEQLGVALRASLDFRIAGGVLDFLYASGDGNLDDGDQNGFKADPNFPMGFLLYRHLLAGQTGRSPVTASDLDLVGVPPADLERFPTRGSASGSVGVFPRLFVRPLEGLEIYGGALFALGASKLSDPFNTRIAGEQRNMLNVAPPGSYLGTELDLGVRFQWVFFGTELTAGIEGGVLLPGNAFDSEDGRMKRIVGGRGMLGYRI